MAEQALRDWLKRVPGVAWSEAARGGTVGKPDCDLPLADGRRIPIELKEWDWLPRKHAWRTHLRPAQVRWCCRETMAGRLSLVMWRTKNVQGERWLAAAGCLPWTSQGYMKPERAHFLSMVKPEVFPEWVAEAFPANQPVPNIHSGVPDAQ